MCTILLLNCQALVNAKYRLAFVGIPVIRLAPGLAGISGLRELEPELEPLLTRAPVRG